MANVVRTVIMFRRATTAEWLANKGVVPAAGEPCFDLELHTLKIGDGTTTYENLPAIGGVDVSADGKTLVLEDGTFKLFGFDAAETNAQPRKNAEGKLEWVVPSTETLDGLQTIVAGLQTDVAELQTNVAAMQEILTPSGEGATTLLDRVTAIEEQMTGTGEGSVDAKIDEKFDEFITNVSDDGVVNTMKELVDYVAEHGPEAANMAASITTLQELVGETSVADQISAVEATLLSKAEAAATLKHIKYEISNKPAEALVDYRDKEIRVMCPADTQWALQNVGANGDASKYYIGFKAYAPDGAVSFKEDTAETIADKTMYSFEGNEFAGVDAYGRKYSIVWLPVAKHNDDDTWTYYGVNSSADKYIGWFYSVEWYDVNGKVIGTDTIRINLSNEACHNNVEPFYMSSVIKGVSVGGTLLDIVDGKVNIPVGAGLKASDEILVAGDGTLSVGQINVSKLVQNPDQELVLDGGGAAK